MKKYPVLCVWPSSLIQSSCHVCTAFAFTACKAFNKRAEFEKPFLLQSVGTTLGSLETMINNNSNNNSNNCNNKFICTQIKKKNLYKIGIDKIKMGTNCTETRKKDVGGRPCCPQPTATTCVVWSWRLKECLCTRLGSKRLGL